MLLGEYVPTLNLIFTTRFQEIYNFFMQFFSQTMSRFTKIDLAYMIIKNYKHSTGNDSLRKVKLSNKPIFMIYVICTGAS